MGPGGGGQSWHMVLSVVFAVLGGLAFAISTVLQQRAASRAPKDESLHLHLLVRLSRDRVWLLGICAAVAAFTLQALALAFGTLTLVQPLLVTDLLFALPIATRLMRRRMDAQEWLGAGLIVGGLALFLVVAAPTSGGRQPTVFDWVVVGAAVFGIGTASGLLSRAVQGTQRAIVLAVGAGVLFGMLAALTKSFTSLLSTVGLVATLTHWQPYVLGVVALAGMVFAQSAFQAGPLAASLPIIDPLEPATAVAVGIFAFHDRITTSPASLAGELLGLIAVIAGIWVLDHSPLVLGMHDVDDGTAAKAELTPGDSAREVPARDHAVGEDTLRSPAPARSTR